MGANPSRVEAWTLYSIGSLIIFARIACRWRMVGLSGFRPDDYVIFLSWGAYTTMTYAADKVSTRGDFHGLSLEHRQALSEDIHGEEAQSYIQATRWFSAGVATYVLFAWTLKLNMLFLYQRIVRGLWVEKFIKPTMVLLAVSFLAIVITLFATCRPYSRMWILFPDQGPLCRPQSVVNMATPLSFNLLTNLIILAIPAPIIFKLHSIPLWKKFLLLVLFVAVAFIMTASILRVVFALLYTSGRDASLWSCREDIVAIMVGQSFLIRPMFRRSFWTGEQKGGDGYASDNSRSGGKAGSSFAMRSMWTNLNKHKDPFSDSAVLDAMPDDAIPLYDRPTGHGFKSSIRRSTIKKDKPDQEQPSPQSENATTDSRGNMVIHVSKRVSVESMEMDRRATQQISEPLDGLQSTHYVRAWNDTAE